MVKCLKNSILNRFWIQSLSHGSDAGEHFVLGEDGDSGHRPGKSNTVRTWKDKHVLK